ncbi:4-hydroxy-tetrahydrodipicolinate synthase [Alkalihalobacillus pseudalcaliphilus]|uniref:4-hydroxy-tetrahydrodipicolinate synthase n=1 Tax=Alkalihalobacillus pseudalcaliphilus TaxID=79884 RepID=UPI000AB273F1|nr:4-hydroxy-tetrahydrodipicolinate synthase [Alkalihalobacillus pseudalcaliphilus]
MNLGRVITAMVTPFNAEQRVDVAKTKQLVEHLISNGTDALVVGGTTGESPTLTHEEKLQLFRTVVQVVNGRIPVIAGTGSNSTQASIELTKEAEKIGVDMVMLVAPYYNKPSQEGLYQHFKAIATSTHLPVMLYNIPGRSSVNINVDTTLRLAQIPNVIATKEASGDLEAMSAIIAQAPDGFLLYSGDDSLTLPVIAIGGAGVVSVSSHVIGNEMQQMIQNYMSGQVQIAALQHRELLPLMKALFATPNPTSVKAALELNGISVGSVRLPLVPLTTQELELLQSYLHRSVSFFVS